MAKKQNAKPSAADSSATKGHTKQSESETEIGEEGVSEALPAAAEEAPEVKELTPRPRRRRTPIFGAPFD